MSVLGKIKSSPLWLILPSVVLLGVVAWAVSTYVPLEFIESLYETPEAEARLLQQIDPEEGNSTENMLIETSLDPDTAEAITALGDGTWTGYAECGVNNTDGWNPYYVATTVVVSNGAVQSISQISGSSTGDTGQTTLFWDPEENQSYLDWAENGRERSGVFYTGVKTQIESAITQGTNPSSIDVVSGATYSSEAIFNSYYAALQKSAAAVGSTVEEPEALTALSQALASGTSSSTGSDTPTTLSAPYFDIASAGLDDGSWTGYAACGVGNDDDWQPYYVAVTIDVSDGTATQITNVEGSSIGDSGDAVLSWDPSENQSYLNWASDGRTRSGVFYTGVRTQIDSALAVGSSPSSIDVVSGATYSSEAIFNAYYAALQKSAASAGTSVEEIYGQTQTDSTGFFFDASGQAITSVGSGNASSTASAGSDNIYVSVEIPTTEATLIDGQYRGYAFCEDEENPDDWSPYYIICDIEVVDGRVSSIVKVFGDSEEIISPFYHYNASENGVYLNKAINGGIVTKGVVLQIQAKLDAGEEVEDIDTISGATCSSKAIINAYTMAVQAAVDAAEQAAAEQSASVQVVNR